MILSLGFDCSDFEGAINYVIYYLMFVKCKVKIHSAFLCLNAT